MFTSCEKTRFYGLLCSCNDDNDCTICCDGASSLIRGERIRKTGDRLIAAPISKAEIFIGKVLGSLVANALCILLVMLFSKFVFQANWGDHLGIIFFIY
ncbi:ABC transporter permease subunit [Bacillus cereus]|uniref:ABC transporter permease subunit n=1 Tax=Bacillus cereus TaxID=1396 RepID=UPI003AF40455